jgi:hypothetical protein
VSASAQAASTLTVTAASTVGSNQLAPRKQSAILFASVLFGCIFLLPAAKKSRLRAASVWMVILLASTIGIVGCSSGTPSTPAAPSTYNFNVVAASGSVHQTTSFTLTVR